MRVEKARGEWKKCINPNCRGRYHINENKIVDIPCKCLKQSLSNLQDFNTQLSRLSDRTNTI